MVTSTILGPDGRPITRADLAEPQTAQLASLQHEWQGHPSRGLTPSKLAGIMDAAEQGDVISQFELFEDMEEKDAHIASEIGKRRRAITLLDWDIVPPSSPYAKEKRAAAQLKEWLTDLPLIDDMLFDVTDAIGKGFVNLEIEWQFVENVWLPKTITHRPQGWFVFHRGYR
jgi:phage gp29-like protein